MNHLALFNGIGGFQLAAQRMGWNNVASVEIDKFCNKVTKYHFPKCTQYEDIKEFNGTPYRGSIDIISGGFPCQDISIANTSKKQGGQRGFTGKGLDYGGTTPVFWGKLDLASSSLKTAQCSLIEDLNMSFSTFPSSGMMLNGDCFMLPNSDFRTLENAYMEWPTPSASDGKILLNKVGSYKKYYHNKHQDKLLYQCHLNGLTAIQAIKMYEWMMGFPKNWIKKLYTDSEMP